MAWLEQEKSGIYHICFRFQGERIKKSAGTRDERKAEIKRARIEENLELVARGHLLLPGDADLFRFLLSDGKLDTQRVDRKQITLTDLPEAYQASLPQNTLSAETLRIATLHMRHLARILGSRRKLRSITRDDLQRYINARSEEIGLRGRPVSTGTISKEVATFRTMWRWARQSDLVASEFPNQGLRYPRQQQKLPFLTWEQIEQRIRRGIPADQTEADYWDCLYLNKDELNELLADVQKSAHYDFLHPMCFMAAHTGARRSELCRSLREDIDFESGSILIRERKKQKGRETFRHVPLSPRLHLALREWLTHSELSSYTFPAEHRVARNRSEYRRENFASVSPDEATDHLSQALSGTKWDKIRGWHIFRHSFISNCASLAVDQRMIDAWVGHQTEDMRKRYRHLFPHRQKVELERVFG